MKFVKVNSLLVGLFVALSAFAGCKHKGGGSSAQGGKVIVEMKTSMGNVTLELDAEKAPKTVENFVNYVKAGFYNGLIFHRIIDGFMVQGGGFDQAMHQKETQAPIQNEASNGLSNKAFTIAMARTNDPNSATAQFFINLVDNSKLDYVPNQSAGYAVFGKVTEGQDVIQKMAKVKTGSKGFYSDVPLEPIAIESMTLK